MSITMRELRDLIAGGCDFSQPLRVVAQDVGKKGGKHSIVRADEKNPAAMNISPGMYDERGTVEVAHDPEAEVLMPEAAIAGLDALLEEVPEATIGWVYFFYFPLEYTGLFGRRKQMRECLLDTNNLLDVYLSDDEPNTLVFKAEYGFGSFDF